MVDPGCLGQGCEIGFYRRGAGMVDPAPAIGLVVENENDQVGGVQIDQGGQIELGS